ncbi:MAG TPA: hypothetical protein VD866_28880 [Urbifossiella sp.]|nr:hypothetical protein [Urbifossiella sp.]
MTCALFGTYQVGAIHGRLITAWSVAALLGPSLVNYSSTAEIDAGVPKAEAYNPTMFLRADLLVVGLVAWNVVAVPLGWGVYQSVQKSLPLFVGPAEPAP